MQVHHLDGDPSNHDAGNLAVLCLECHNLTQLTGGFDRKLDPEQVRLYRDDWHVRVARRRDSSIGSPLTVGPPPAEQSEDVALVTTLADIYRERERWWDLALLYHRVANDELRDKYFDKALEADPSDEMLIRARRVQGRLTEVPRDVMEAHLAEVTAGDLRDWSYEQMLLREMGRPLEAARVLLDGLGQSLAEGNTFTTGFYLKRALLDGLVDDLFKTELRAAAERGDLWWQVRALQELGWQSALEDFLDEHGEEIRTSEDLLLQRLLAQHEDDGDRLLAIEKIIAEDPIAAYFTDVEPDDDSTDKTGSNSDDESL